jgi:hypothetical protein
MSKPQKPVVAGEKLQTKGALHEHVRQMFMLERLCSRFPLVAAQLRSRHDHRETLCVEDEYDVRDLLHALLTLEHADIRAVDWTPSYSGGQPQTDFLLASEQLVVEAKKTRDGFGARELDEQLLVDVQNYSRCPDCRTLVCFVYDPEGRIASPRETEHELSAEKNGLAVRVMIAPKAP